MTPRSETPPNVLFLVSDDLRPQLGCYGCDPVRSPNLDALARDGMVFDRAYCQQAVCAPSRASVLSGCRPDTTGVFDLRTPLRTTMPDVVTLPQHFRRNGYETVSVGKVYHHADEDPPGWSRPPRMVRGDWKGRGYLTDEAIEAIAANRDRCAPREGLGPAWECADVPDNAYHDGANAELAIGELERLAHGAREGTPFFLAVGFLKPHLPFSAPKRYWDMYDPAGLPLAANPFAPENATEFSLTDWGELRGYFGMPDDGPMGDDEARTLIHAYCACVSYMDAQVGRVLERLEQLGLRETTAVCFWGDHGWKLGEHGSWCKHTNFEIDARAPLLVSPPGLAGRALRTRALVEFVDMYPTLCELAGLDVPDHCEGLSMVPLLDDPDRPWKSAAFSQFPRKGDRVMGYAMRTDRYRYVEWRDRASGETLARELYDHSTDPQENINAAARADQEGVIRELSARLAAGWEQALPPGVSAG